MKTIRATRGNCGVLFTVADPRIKAVGDGEMEVRGKPSAFYKNWFRDFKLQACMPGHCRLHFLVRLLGEVDKVSEGSVVVFYFAVERTGWTLISHSLGLWKWIH